MLRHSYSQSVKIKYFKQFANIKQYIYICGYLKTLKAYGAVDYTLSDVIL